MNTIITLEKDDELFPEAFRATKRMPISKK